MAKNKKYTKPVAPRPSLFAYEPYIEGIKREITMFDKYLEDMRERRVAVDPRFWGVETGVEVYDLFVERRNARAVIVNNYKRWVELSAPVLVPDEKERPMENVESPDSFWYEEDLHDLNEGKYFKRLTVPSGKWKDILNLRGHLLMGDPLQVKMLRDLYITVFSDYTYAHGFKMDKLFYIAPKDDWRDKMGIITVIDGKPKVIIKK